MYLQGKFADKVHTDHPKGNGTTCSTLWTKESGAKVHKYISGPSCNLNSESHI